MIEPKKSKRTFNKSSTEGIHAGNKKDDLKAIDNYLESLPGSFSKKEVRAKRGILLRFYEYSYKEQASIGSEFFKEYITNMCKGSEGKIPSYNTALKEKRVIAQYLTTQLKFAKDKVALKLDTTALTPPLPTYKSNLKEGKAFIKYLFEHQAPNSIMIPSYAMLCSGIRPEDAISLNWKIFREDDFGARFTSFAKKTSKPYNVFLPVSLYNVLMEIKSTPYQKDGIPYCVQHISMRTLERKFHHYACDFLNDHHLRYCQYPHAKNHELHIMYPSIYRKIFINACRIFERGGTHSKGSKVVGENYADMYIFVKEKFDALKDEETGEEKIEGVSNSDSDDDEEGRDKQGKKGKKGKKGK